MVTTRSSDRPNGSNNPSVAGEKHDLEKKETAQAPDTKRVKKEAPEGSRQTTLEEAVSTTDRDEKGEDALDSNEENPPKHEDQDHAAQTKHEANGVSKASGTTEKPNTDKEVPSSILEKGIIYFFFRPRVNIEHPKDVKDIARTYIILRPMAPDARLGSGPIGDAGNSRILAIPKKTFPQSGRERYMVFVDKTAASFQEIKDHFLEGVTRETKTKGTSVIPEAVPAAEGVYLITNTGRSSHLAYAVTRPKELGEVQEELGLKKQGSFIVSTKNPKFPGPQNVQFPQSPNFSEEIMAELRDLRWAATKPDHLDYANTQLLFIGESSGIEKATKPQKKDQEEGKEEPKEILEEFEEEDLQRMKNLSDSDAVYKDLEAHAGDYPELLTTF